MACFFFISNEICVKEVYIRALSQTSLIRVNYKYGKKSVLGEKKNIHISIADN